MEKNIEGPLKSLRLWYEMSIHLQLTAKEKRLNVKLGKTVQEKRFAKSL